MSNYSGGHSQVEWEEHFSIMGIQKFLDNEERSARNGEGYTTSGRILMRKYVPKVAQIVSEHVVGSFSSKKGKELSDYHRPAEFYAIMNSDILTCSYIAVQTTLSKLKRSGVGLGESSLSLNIGSTIEEELLGVHLHSDNKAIHKSLLNTIPDTPRNVRLKQRLFREALQTKGWESWGRELRTRVGYVYLRAIEKSGLVVQVKTSEFSPKYGYRTKTYIHLSDKVLEWIRKNTANMAANEVIKMPAIEPLKLLTSDNLNQGHTLLPSVGSPFSSPQIFKDEGLPQGVLDAINKLSSVPYEVNEKVFKVMETLVANGTSPSLPDVSDEPPPRPNIDGFEKWDKEKFEQLSSDDKAIFKEYLEESRTWKAEHGRLASKSITHTLMLSAAREMLGVKERLGVDKFYHPMLMDFRGRLYYKCKALDPQGADPSKALIQFHNKKVLGSRGRFWLAVHGANCYGIDKVSLEERVKWVESNESFIRRVAIDPTDSDCLAYWGTADSPYQFLAFCFEWNGMLEVGEDVFESGLPVGMDGSCNGIQHYSAMLWDNVGAQHTNLMDGDCPNDIYRFVADTLRETLVNMEDDTGFRDKWLETLFDRKLTKTSVMTLPYGITSFTVAEHIKSYADEHLQDIFPTGANRILAAKFLTPLLWGAMTKTIVKGMEAMRWLRDAANEVVKKGDYLIYTAPNGLVVKLGYERFESKKLRFKFSGNVIRMRTTYGTGEVDTSKSKISFAPNFIHSCDASHLTATVNSFDGDILSVHDSYSTVACDIDELHVKLREAFYNLYKDGDVLDKIKVELEQRFDIELPPPPTKGSYDISCVLNSTYFFS